MRSAVSAVIISAILISLFGCGKSAEKPEASKPTGETKTASGIRELKELKITDVKVGTGRAVKKDDILYMTYTGTLKDGTQFDSNAGPDGNPFRLVLGTGMVIKGWDDGLVGMKVGGERKLEIPANLAYGEQSPMEKIPAGADLYFTVRLDDAIIKGEEEFFDKKDIQVGTGRAVAMGDLIEAQYLMKLPNGKVIDDRMAPDKKVTFRVGPRKAESDQLIPTGLSAALVGTKVGGTRFVRLPPLIGWGTDTSGGVPVNSIIHIEVKVVKVL